MKFPFYKQHSTKDCGPACLRMIAKYHGRKYSFNTLKRITEFTTQGVSLLGISSAAQQIGFKTLGVKVRYEELIDKIPLPCIAHWNQNHFVVIIGTKGSDNQSIMVADPSRGILEFSKQEFEQYWLGIDGNSTIKGNVLLLEPTNEFFEKRDTQSTHNGWKTVFSYIHENRWLIVRIFIAVVIASSIQLIIPYLTQEIVDNGIGSKDLGYITILLTAQLMLVFSRSIADFIRTRILLHVSIVINLSLASDFWVKLTRLPISYFDRHHAGDTIQRISDNKKIESFLTNSVISTLLLFLNTFLLAVILIKYDTNLFLIFSTGSILYLIWISFFLKIRRKLNYQTFQVSAKENNSTLQLIHGMSEIKLNNAERAKRWEWEKIQAEISKLNVQELKYSQYQQIGAVFINQGKDIFITFMVARSVVKGELTLGVMMAIQFILGQLSNAVEQFLQFFKNAQDANISMERISEINGLEEEQSQFENYITQLPGDKSIYFNQINFKYPGAGNEYVLKNLSFSIPEGKVTAIVGASGSGKTTLLKLLLRFYTEYEGRIYIGTVDFKEIKSSFWRSNCGSVLQEGYIFNDTIEGNIAISDDELNTERLFQACKTANIISFIQALPNGFKTMLGADGISLSQGQKQRLLIARAIYKNPAYLILDEATNSLDANNEREIVESLSHYFKEKTVIIVAHRLSTVKNADKILVLNDGEICEEGDHKSLYELKGKYFELVRNQIGI